MPAFGRTDTFELPTEVTDRRVQEVLSEQQVQLRVELMPKEEFDHQFPCCDLRCKATQPFLIRVCWNPDCQLIAEILSKLPFPCNSRGLIYLLLASDEAHGRSELILRQLLHADEKPATMAVAPGPILHERIYPAPPTQIEVTDAEVSPFRKPHSLRKGGQKVLVYVVKYLGHDLPPTLTIGCHLLTYCKRSEKYKKRRVK
jgi:hypothetical protein